MRTRLLPLFAIALAACGKAVPAPKPPAPVPGCTRNTDCLQSPVQQACVAAACVPICAHDTDCGTGRVCDDGLCAPAVCSSDLECAAGLVCLAGKCGTPVPAAAVASCELAPDGGVVHSGHTLQLALVVRGSDGGALGFKGARWSAVGDAVVDGRGRVTGSVPVGAVGSATVTAAAGERQCKATLAVYPPANSSLRVVVSDARTRRPLPGALVLLDTDSAGARATDSNGVAVFDAAPGAHNVHAFERHHNYTSLIQVRGRDLLLPLVSRDFRVTQEAGLVRSRFQRDISAADFANLREAAKTAHVAFFSSGVSGSLTDLALATLTGQAKPISFDLGQRFDTFSPMGLVLGLNDNLFGTGSPSLWADPGKQAVWGIGGNIDVNEILPLAQALSAGHERTLPALLPALIKLVGKLQTGQAIVDAPSDQALNPTRIDAVRIPLNTPLALRAGVELPLLPKAGGEFVDGLVAVAGASAWPLGFVPLGLSGGLAESRQGARTGRVLDPTCDASAAGAQCAGGLLPLRLAPLSNGLEGSGYSVALFAVEFTEKLMSLQYADLAVSALIKTVPSIGGPDQAGMISFAGRSFPPIPPAGAVAYDRQTHQLSVPMDADGVPRLHRLDLDLEAAPVVYRWLIYYGPDTAGGRILLPDPRLLDPDFPPYLQASDLDARLLTLDLEGPGTSYEELAGFGDVTLDSLGDAVRGFSVRSVPLPLP